MKEKVSAEKEAKKEKRLIKLLPKELSKHDVEIKLLEEEDIDDVLHFLSHQHIDATKEEVLDVIKDKASYGAYVNRQLIGLVLSWPVCFERETKDLHNCEEGEVANALYIQTIDVNDMYKDSGAYRALLEAEAEKASELKLKFLMVLFEGKIKGPIEAYINGEATYKERFFYNEGFMFFNHVYGILAIRRV